MYVSDLKQELDTLPSDAWVDVMFLNDGNNIYTLEGVELYNLSQGNQRVVITIADTTPLRAV